MKKSITPILVASTLLLAGCGKSRHAIDALVTGNELTASNQAAPLDLTTNYTTPISYFDEITQFPAWKTVPRGRQIFEGVPLDRAKSPSYVLRFGCCDQ